MVWRHRESFANRCVWNFKGNQIMEETLAIANPENKEEVWKYCTWKVPNLHRTLGETPPVVGRTVTLPSIHSITSNYTELHNEENVVIKACFFRIAYKWGPSHQSWIWQRTLYDDISSMPCFIGKSSRSDGGKERFIFTTKWLDKHYRMIGLIFLGTEEFYETRNDWYRPSSNLWSQRKVSVFSGN